MCSLRSGVAGVRGVPEPILGRVVTTVRNRMRSRSGAGALRLGLEIGVVKHLPQGVNALVADVDDWSARSQANPFL